MRFLFRGKKGEEANPFRLHTLYHYPHFLSMSVFRHMPKNISRASLSEEQGKDGMSIGFSLFLSSLFDLKSTPGHVFGAVSFAFRACSVAIIYNYVNRKQARRETFGVCSWCF